MSEAAKNNASNYESLKTATIGLNEAQTARFAILHKEILITETSTAATELQRKTLIANKLEELGLEKAQAAQTAQEILSAQAKTANTAATTTQIAVDKAYVQTQVQKRLAKIGLNAETTKETALAIANIQISALETGASKAGTFAKVQEALATAGVSSAIAQNTANKIVNIGANGGLLASTKALTTGLLASAAAWAVTPMGMATIAVAGIWALGSAFSYLSKQQQESIDKAKELADSYNQTQKSISDNISTIEGLKSRFNELSSGVDEYGKNISLSNDDFREYHSIVEQIIGVSPSLRTGWTEEGKAIASKNNLIERSIELLRLEQKEKLAGMLTDEKVKTAAEGAKAEATKAQKFTKSGTDFTYETEYQIMSPFLNSTIADNRADLLKSILEKELGITQGFGQRYEDFVRENFQNIVEISDKIKNEVQKEGGDYQGALSDEQLDTLLNSVATFKKNYQQELKELEKAQKSFNPTLELAAQYSEFYDDLTAEQKDFITKYIDGFKITGKESNAELQKMVDDMTKFVDGLGQNTNAQNAISNLFKVNDLELNASDYAKQLQGALDNVQSTLNLTDDQIINITTKFNIDPSSVQQIKDDLRDQIGITDEENDIRYQVIVDLANNLKLPELKEAHRIISDIEDESKKLTTTEQLSKFFDNTSLINNVRVIQTAANEGSISILQANNDIEESFAKAYGTSADGLKLFMQIFGLIPPTVTNATNETLSSLNSLVEGFDKLRNAYFSLQQGEPLSFDTVLELIDKYPDLISKLQVDENGVMSLSKDAIKKIMDAQTNEFRIGIENRKASIEKSINELELQLGKTSDAIERQDIKDKVDTYNKDLENLGKLENVDVTNQTTDFDNFLKSIDRIQSTSSMFKSAQKEMSDSGELSLETFKKFADVTPSITDYIDIQNGKLKFNAEAWNKNEGSVAAAKKALQDYTATLPPWNERTEKQLALQKYLYDEMIRQEQGIKSASERMQELNDQLDSLQSSYKTLIDATKEYNENGGKLTIDTFQSLLKLSPQYLATLDLESGKLSINEKKVRSLTEALKAEAIVTLQSAAVDDILAISKGNLTEASEFAQTAVSNLGTNTADAGNKAAQAAPGMLAAAVAMEAMNNAAKGIDMESQVGKNIKAVTDAYSELVDNIAGMTIDFSPSSVTGDKEKSSTDKWLEAFKKAYDELKHLRAMDIINDEQYYDRLSELNDKYFAGNDKYIEEYRKNLEELYNLQKTIIKNSIDDIQSAYQAVSKAIDEYNEYGLIK